MDKNKPQTKKKKKTGNKRHSENENTQLNQSVLSETQANIIFTVNQVPTNENPEIETLFLLLSLHFMANETKLEA